MNELKRILYGEDSPNDVELTLAAFQECNLANKVDVVSDGQEVMDYLNREGSFAARDPGLPVLVLLDLKMPKLDGIDVLKRMKGDPRFRSIPVVILTSSREERDLVESYRLGVNAYVVKPVGLADFIDTVKKLGMFWAVINEVPAVPGGET